MRRAANGEIALGFALGILVFLFVAGVTSYQIQHCGEINRQTRGGPAQNKPSAPSEDGKEGNSEQPRYDDSHPVSCGIVGLPASIVLYMDHNEGFFVGGFTLALFLATVFLWRSTYDLWEAGERQIAIAQASAKVAADALRHAEVAGHFDLRAYLNVSPQITTSGRSYYARINVENSGKTPARNVQFRTGVCVAENAFDEGLFDKTTIDYIGIINPASEVGSQILVEFSAEETAALFKHEKSLYMFGRIDFGDSFQNRQWISYRFKADRWPNPATWNICERGNDSS